MEIELTATEIDIIKTGLIDTQMYNDDCIRQLENDRDTRTHQSRMSRIALLNYRNKLIDKLYYRF